MKALLTIAGHSRPCEVLKEDSVKGYFIQFETQRMWVSKKQITLPGGIGEVMIASDGSKREITQVEDKPDGLTITLSAPVRPVLEYSETEDVDYEEVGAHNADVLELIDPRLIELTPPEADLLIQSDLT